MKSQQDAALSINHGVRLLESGNEGAALQMFRDVTNHLQTLQRGICRSMAATKNHPRYVPKHDHSSKTSIKVCGASNVNSSSGVTQQGNRSNNRKSYPLLLPAAPSPRAVQGNTIKSLFLYNRAVQLSEPMSMTSDRDCSFMTAVLVFNMAILHQQHLNTKNNLLHSVKLYQMSLKILRNYSFCPLKLICMNNLALLETEIGNYESASKYLCQMRQSLMSREMQILSLELLTPQELKEVVLNIRCWMPPISAIEA